MSSKVLDHTKLNMPDFDNNRLPRSGFNFVFYFALIITMVAVGLGVGVVWLAMGFNKSPNTNLFDPDNSSYKSYKTSVEAALGLCAGSCVFLIILAVLYFRFLEDGFTFSQKLSNNMAVASQGTDRLRKVGDLLSGMVYRNPEDAEQRAGYANNLLSELRRSYYRETGVSPTNRDMQRYASRIRHLTPEQRAAFESNSAAPGDLGRQAALIRSDAGNFANVYNPYATAFSERTGGMGQRLTKAWKNPPGRIPEQAERRPEQIELQGRGLDHARGIADALMPEEDGGDAAVDRGPIGGGVDEGADEFDRHIVEEGDKYDRLTTGEDDEFHDAVLPPVGDPLGVDPGME